MCTICLHKEYKVRCINKGARICVGYIYVTKFQKEYGITNVLIRRFYTITFALIWRDTIYVRGAKLIMRTSFLQILFYAFNVKGGMQPIWHIFLKYQKTHFSRKRRTFYLIFFHIRVHRPQIFP